MSDKFFFIIEDTVLFDEEICFDESKIRDLVLNKLLEAIHNKFDKERGFYFEELIYGFFEYIGVEVIKTKKTRDFGIDGVIKLGVELLGEVDLGLQIKNTIVDSTDVDGFLTCLKNSELRLGVLVCKDSRKFDRYDLNSKINAILMARGVKLREKLIKERIDINPVFERIDINPVFVMKLDDIADIVASRIRGLVRMVYKA